MADEVNHADAEATRDSGAAHSPLARAIHNTAWNVIGLVLTVALNFASVFILARRLGADLLGIYFSVFSLAVVVHFLLEGGITTVLTHRIAREPDKLKKHVAEATGLLMLISLTSVAVLLVCGLAWSAWEGIPMRWGVFLFAGVAVASRQMLEFAACALRGLERFKFENLSRILQTLVFFGGVLLLVDRDSKNGLFMAQLAFMLSNVVGGVFLAGVLLTKWDCAGFSFRPAIVKEWFVESLPLGVGDTVRRLTWQVDTLLLGILQPPAAVGLYSLAYRPLQPLQLVPRTIASVTFPGLTRMAHQGDTEGFARLFSRSVLVMWIVSLPICVVIAVCAWPLIVIPAGVEYAGAVAPLQLVIWTIAMIFITTQLRYVMMALGAQRGYWRATTIVLVVKVVLEASLIPIWGLYGACWGTIIGEVLLTVLMLGMIRRMGVASLQYGPMIRAALAGAAMAGAMWPFRDASPWVLMLISVVAGCLYLCLCALFRVVERGEFAQFIEVSRGLVARRLHRGRRDRFRSTPSPLGDLEPDSSGQFTSNCQGQVVQP